MSLGSKQLADCAGELSDEEQDLGKHHSVSRLIHLLILQSCPEFVASHVLHEILQEVCLVVRRQRSIAVVYDLACAAPPVLTEFKASQLQVEPDPAVYVVLEDVHEEYVVVLLLLELAACHQVDEGISADIILVRGHCPGMIKETGYLLLGQAPGVERQALVIDFVAKDSDVFQLRVLAVHYCFLVQASPVE